MIRHRHIIPCWLSFRILSVTKALTSIYHRLEQLASGWVWDESSAKVAVRARTSRNNCFNKTQQIKLFHFKNRAVFMFYGPQFAEWERTCQLLHGKQLLIGKSMVFEAAKAVINIFVLSRVDYCNGLLIGWPRYLLDRLRSFLNSAAKYWLHWLHVSQRVAVMEWRHSTSPSSAFLCLLPCHHQWSVAKRFTCSEYTNQV